MIEIENELYAAVQTLGKDMVMELARGLVRARKLHQVFAYTPAEAASVVNTEAGELMAAVYDQESVDRQKAEALDTAVTAIRYMNLEWLPEFGHERLAETSEEYFRPAAQVWGDDLSRGVSEPRVDTNSENVLREDTVNHPSHYTAYPVEVIDMIRVVLGPEGFRAYCFGNEIKYRMRAGLKGDVQQDINKAMKYKEFRNGLE